jgi:hypothetical protein
VIGVAFRRSGCLEARGGYTPVINTTREDDDVERAGPTPDAGIRPADLVELSARPGPFATVWLGRTGTGGWGRADDGISATDACNALAEGGAPAAVVDHVAAALDAVDPDAHGVVVVADEAGVAVVEPLPDRPRRDVASWAAVPALSPVLEHRQGDVPVLVVLADRTGADVIVRRPGGHVTTEQVEGEDWPVRKVRGGGWSHRRIQQRAEDSWEHNAKAVADEVRLAANRTRPHLVVVGGDERAVHLVVDALPADVAAATRTITHGRAADGSEDVRDATVDRLVRTVVAQETVDLLHAFDDQTGARAANGADATLGALARSQVDVLLVHDDEADGRTAWVADQPGLVASRREVLADMGATGLREGRLVDVAVNAALRTGAAVRVVPDVASIEEGLAAILRWSDDGSGAAV